ncbi:uncharacterized protein LOC134838263 [Culicoides brevitarsis]|uniref:uncharacterized protein LOC134838263 n=1 Tax=Culicoides brevitarsis TaxID=469753 RepID=UPI00307B3B17
MEDLSLGRQLFAQQQKGKFTDCSFLFKIKADNGEVQEKVIHAHKLILSVASNYFETHFKRQWSNNEPILIETVEFSLFEKLIRAIYLNVTHFDSLKEAADLYEAAHFYEMETVLELLRRDIKRFLQAEKDFRISSIGNIAWKYNDIKLTHCTANFMIEYANRVNNDPDFVNLTPEFVIPLFICFCLKFFDKFPQDKLQNMMSKCL